MKLLKKYTAIFRLIRTRSRETLIKSVFPLNEGRSLNIQCSEAGRKSVRKFLKRQGPENGGMRGNNAVRFYR